MISFVILHYQALDETLECVATIKNNVQKDKYIVIVDNASPNNSGKDLEDYFKDDPEVKVLITTDNLGFAKGNNLGYQEAKKIRPDFIVVMNNDVFLTQNNFYELVFDSYQKYNYDILGPDIFSTKTSLHQNPQRFSNYTLDELKQMKRKLILKKWFKFLLRIKYFFNPSPTEHVEQLTDFNNVQFDKPLHGAAYIFSKKFIDKYDFCFQPITFMYFESYILHYWAMSENMITVYEPSIKVIHHEDVSTNQSYKGMYKKASFVNDCLLDSCNAFIDFIEGSRSF